MENAPSASSTAKIRAAFDSCFIGDLAGDARTLACCPYRARVLASYAQVEFTMKDGVTYVMTEDEVGALTTMLGQVTNLAWRMRLRDKR